MKILNRTHKNLHWFFLAAFILFSIVASASLSYKQTLDITNGLSDNAASCMYKDSRGYLWIGTFDGLCRYNDYDISIYKNEIGRQLYHNNRIKSVTEDNYGRLWIGTDFGLTIFNYETYDFKQITDVAGFPPTIVRKVYIENDRAICIAENRCIFIYDMDGNLLRCDRIPTEHIILDVEKLSSTEYLLAHNEGLFHYDSNKGKTTLVESKCKLPVKAIKKYKENGFILAYSNGIQKISVERDIRQNRHEVRPEEIISHKNLEINSISISKEGLLLLGSEKGGIFYFKNWKENLQAETPISIFENLRVNQSLVDDDRIWISTFNNGVLELDGSNPTFKVMSEEELSMPEIVDYDGDRVLVNETNTLSIYNRKTLRREPLPFAIDRRLKGYNKVLWKSDKGVIWVVSKNENNKTELHKIVGNKTIKLDSEKLKVIKQGKTHGTTPLNVTGDKEGNLWVAYLNDLYRISFDLDGEIDEVLSVWETDYVKEIEGFAYPRALYYDKKENLLWLGSNHKGLFRIKLDNQQKKSLADLEIDNFMHNPNTPESISSDFVSAVLRTNDGTLWVGTGYGGFCKVNENADQLSFEVKSTNDGLSNNVVKILTEDQFGNLWIGTNIGLNLYDVQQNRITTFGQENGLKYQDFWYSSIICPDGELVMSCVNNIIVFDPEQCYTDATNTKLYFDDLKIYNQEIYPNKEYDNRIVYKKRFRDGDTLKLNYNENVFSINIDAISDKTSVSHLIKYKLLPSNSEWIELSKENRTIAINGLKAGKYQLLVKDLGSHHQLRDEIKLNLIIYPPIWKTTTAYLLYIVVVLMIIGAMMYAILSYQTISHNLRIKTMEKSANEDKLRYFSNISHELKTPLSLILAPLTLLKERFALDTDVRSKLELIGRQSKKLLDLVELTHGIEANDVDGLKASKTVYSFGSMIDDIAADFELVAKYNNKNFIVERTEKPIAVEADRGMLEKVVNNLLSNAMKHTQANDTIKISYSLTSDKKLKLNISDTGYGIAESDLPHIFDRFYKAKTSIRNVEGTGIGLTFAKLLVELHNGEIYVTSKLTEGTTFSVVLPIVVDAVLKEKTKEPEVKRSEIIGFNDCSEISLEHDLSAASVYIVDDNDELRSILTEIVGAYFNVKSFRNGRELIESLEMEWPDLVISDVMMPEMDGCELCSRIKGDIKTSHIPVILLTACTTVDDKIKGLKIGADAYIPKPFYPKHLITRIETLLYNRKLLRERFQVGIPLVYNKDSNTSDKDNEFMAKLYKLFDDNLDNEDINLDLLARDLGQNRSIFFKKVKVITNTTPNELLKEFRLTKAAELLQTGELSIKEVCVMTGFKDRSHFSRVFKAKYNVSPGRYSLTKV